MFLIEPTKILSLFNYLLFTTMPDQTGIVTAGFSVSPEGSDNRAWRPG